KCPICYPRKLGGNSTKRITEEEFLKRFKDKLSDEYTYISGFKNTKENILIRHNVCDHEYKVSPNMLLGSRNRRCPNYTNNKRGSKADKNYLDNILLESNMDNEYEWLNGQVYNNDNKEKYRIKHIGCGNIYDVRPNDFQQGYRCPYCSLKSSDEEESLYDFIKDNYKGEIIKNYRDQLELDVYLPDLNIGFEYNGTYWHSDRFKDKNYHLRK